ncbi:MAG: ArdC-like ssDNA-binding domain-containing protein [Anaerolineaceae bacterium]
MMETQTNTHDLQKKIASYLETLAKETDEARRSESMQKYLEFAARFHKYSSYNVMLILLSKPDATNVAGYQTWRKLNRYVKKGERGLAIFAPMIHKEDSDKDTSPKVLYGFRIVYVFDISQTNGEPLPPQPDWKSPEKNVELTKKLIAFANAKGIKVTFTMLVGETQGFSTGSEITIDISAGFKTVVHEVCHSLIHFDKTSSWNREIKELQAEATAFIVARHFGIDGLNSANYIALFGLNSKDILSHTEVIQRTASEIIREVEAL